jgi:hypothetical protein
LKRLSESSPWLHKPELTEIKEIVVSAGPNQKEGRTIFEFALNVLIKPPAVNESATPVPRSSPQTQSVEPIKVGSAQ